MPDTYNMVVLNKKTIVLQRMRTTQHCIEKFVIHSYLGLLNGITIRRNFILWLSRPSGEKIR